MRVLVTGGAGYVGSVSVERLVAAGHAVTVLDDRSTGHLGSIVDGATFHEGSCGDGAVVAALLERARIEAILHCAARSVVGESMRDPARYYRDNVAGGIALLEAARSAGVRRVVFSSTAAVYGAPAVTPITEATPLAPINPYGETKRTFEGALGWYGAAYGLRSVSLRYFNVAGASERNGEDHDPETHLIPSVLAAAGGGFTVTLFGDDHPTPDGTPIRDYIHVEDLAVAHLLALEATALDDRRTLAPDGSGAALRLNLGSGTGFSVLQVVATAERIVGRPIARTMGPRRVGDPPVLVAAADLAGTVLGWRAERSDLETMIGSAWAWRQRHPDGYGGR